MVHDKYHTIIYKPIMMAAKGISDAQSCHILKDNLFFLFTVPTIHTYVSIFVSTRALVCIHIYIMHKTDIYTDTELLLPLMFCFN
jgi:hypothetical protein